MNIITTDSELKKICEDLSNASYIAIDTEFLRDKTYYAKLCLIQIASLEVEAFAIDPIANPDIDLSPFFDLMFNEKILKIFHAGRQDLEIFFHLTGKIPTPIYDTQIAAMVCGYGEQIGYNNLVKHITGHEVDKTNQYTDWSRRPLTDKQLAYALDDVIYLVKIYESISATLKKEGRETWVKEEMEELNNPLIYNIDKNEIWRRIKVKTNKPRVLTCLKELAAWREVEARKRDIPRPRIIKDDILANIAMHLPKDKKQLARIRGVSDDFANGSYGSKVLKIIEKSKDVADIDAPKLKNKKAISKSAKSILEMLRMLLKIRSNHFNVVPKLVASASDLEEIAISDNPDTHSIKGWRKEVFGDLAMKLKKGEIAITIKNGDIDIIEL